MYVPHLISIPFVLSKIWLRGDKYANIQGMSMVLVHCPSLPSIYKPSSI